MEKFYVAILAVVLVVLFVQWYRTRKNKIDKDYAAAIAVIMPYVVKAVMQFADSNVSDEQIAREAKKTCHAIIPGKPEFENVLCSDTIGELAVKAWHAMKDQLE